MVVPPHRDGPGPVHRSPLPPAGGDERSPRCLVAGAASRRGGDRRRLAGPRPHVPARSPAVSSRRPAPRPTAGSCASGCCWRSICWRPRTRRWTRSRAAPVSVTRRRCATTSCAPWGRLRTPTSTRSGAEALNVRRAGRSAGQRADGRRRRGPTRYRSRARARTGRRRRSAAVMSVSSATENSGRGTAVSTLNGLALGHVLRPLRKPAVRVELLVPAGVPTPPVALDGVRTVGDPPHRGMRYPPSSVSSHARVSSWSFGQYGWSCRGNAASITGRDSAGGIAMVVGFDVVPCDKACTNNPLSAASRRAPLPPCRTHAHAYPHPTIQHHN
ncbi:hypothetical protein SHIRM173S_05666 [Streptomyces hirsutus]